MTTQRPNAFVSQEFDTLETTAVSPSLDVLVVGPCYQILDYLDDKTDCLIGATTKYGTLHKNNAATFSTIQPAALAVATPPGQTAGATLIPDSVKIFFDLVNVCVTHCEAASGYPQYYASDNLFFASATPAIAPGGIHFAHEEVAAGDTLIVTPNGAGDDYVMTVRELCQTLLFVDATAYTTTVVPGDIITMTSDHVSPTRNGVYTVKRVYTPSDVLSAYTAAIEIEELPTSFTGNLGTTATNLVITSSTGVVKHTLHVVADDWCTLRTTADFAAGHPASGYWRIERTVNDVEVDSSYVTVDPTTLITTIAGSAKLDLSTTLLDKEIMYAVPYMEYMAWRNDLQNIYEAASAPEIERICGKYDARNPLCVGAVVAKGNTTTTVKFYGLAYGDGVEVNQYSGFIEAISAYRAIYTIVPLTDTQAVLSLCTQDATNQADPTYILTNGIRQKFRAVLGSLALYTERMIGEEMTSATTSEEPFDTSTDKRKLTLSVTTLTAPNFITGLVLPGHLLTIKGGGVVYGPYTISQVDAALVLHVETDLDVALTGDFNTAGDYFYIGTALVPSSIVNLIIPPVPATNKISLAQANQGKKWRDLTDITATFLADDVLPGDVLEIPSDPNTTTFTTHSSFVIDQVLSETRIRIMDNGWNTSTVENELPHGAKRTGGALVNSSSIHYRIMRNMTKPEQVTYMLQITAGLSDKRLVLCYPNRVDIEGLVDGSLARTATHTDPMDADPQPGYYLACAVGGLTAGQPSHQGFTNMPINMITRVYDSWDYFSEQQLTDLSNGGVYLFVQDNPDSAPYTIHEVTTDVSALQFAEYMTRKNFDYIAWMHLDAILPFIGPWNTNEEALGAIRMACVTVEGNLMGRLYPRIGRPLESAEIRNVAISTLSSDRIDTYVNVGLPMVLNTVGVHLIA